jgi:hypothetical protein
MPTCVADARDHACPPAGLDSTLADVHRTMIIAPFEGDFATKLAAAARAAGWRTALARTSVPGQEGPGEGLAEGDDPPRLAWNPASYVSAGALSLSAGSRFDDLETLVIVCDPSDSDRSLFESSPGGLGSSIEAAVAGPVFLAREFARLFGARKSGRILMVSVEGAPRHEDGAAPGSGAFASLVSSAFRGLGEGLFDRARGASWSAWGIVEKSGKHEAAADFALRLLDEQKTTKSGRWLSFNGKAGIFGVF